MSGTNTVGPEGIFVELIPQLVVETRVPPVRQQRLESITALAVLVESRRLHDEQPKRRSVARKVRIGGMVEALRFCRHGPIKPLLPRTEFSA
jgi:hypothetical protein